jgi:hypothetical protein
MVFREDRCAVTITVFDPLDALTVPADAPKHA